jgi:hypothetical protein
LLLVVMQNLSLLLPQLLLLPPLVCFHLFEQLLAALGHLVLRAAHLCGSRCSGRR